MEQKLQQTKTISYQLKKASPAVNQQIPTPGINQNNQANKRSKHPESLASISMTVQPHSAHKHEGKVLALPMFKPASLNPTTPNPTTSNPTTPNPTTPNPTTYNSNTPNLTTQSLANPSLTTQSLNSYRPETNPAQAIHLLEELKGIVSRWHWELEEVLEKIEDVYLEGPIVDGWLECDSAPQIAGGQSGNYIEKSTLVKGQPKPQINYQQNYKSYRLCGLDVNGQVWCRPCPAEQVESLSIAIARYQKLQQLLTRKQYLETLLGQMVETLTVLRSHLKE